MSSDKQKKRAATVGSKKLDWDNFNFIENLLGFCPNPTRLVDKENGIYFRITKPEGNKSFCILFKIDRQPDPLIEAGKRPDYMVMFVQGNDCICTIIEMKGKRDAKEAVIQLTAFYDRIREEIRDNLPSRFKIHFQGIVLCSYISQIPLEVIKNEDKRGFSISVLQYGNKAELYPYISKKLSIADKYIHESIRISEPDLLIESMFMNAAQLNRTECDFRKANFHRNDDRSGIYIDYKKNTSSSHIVLKSDSRKMVLATAKTDVVLTATIQEELIASGLSSRVSLESLD